MTPTEGGTRMTESQIERLLDELARIATALEQIADPEPKPTSASKLIHFREVTAHDIH